MLFSLHEQTTPAAAAYIFDVEGGIVPCVSPDTEVNEELDAILSCHSGLEVVSGPDTDPYDRWDNAVHENRASFVLDALSHVMRRHELQILRGTGVPEAAAIAAKELRRDRRATAFVSRLTPGILREELGDSVRGALFEQPIRGNEALVRSVRKAQLFLDTPERQTVFVSSNERVIQEIQRRTRIQTLTVQLGELAVVENHAAGSECPTSPLVTQLSTV